MSKKPYDVTSKVDEFSGFYEWNKSTFYVKKSDERYERFRNQKKECGFTDEETWTLYHNIALFIYPRIKRFTEIIEDGVGTPYGLTLDEWVNILKKIVFAFECLVKEDDLDEPFDKETNKRIEEGLDLFREWFFALWW